MKSNLMMSLFAVVLVTAYTSPKFQVELKDYYSEGYKVIPETFTVSCPSMAIRIRQDKCRYSVLMGKGV